MPVASLSLLWTGLFVSLSYYIKYLSFCFALAILIVLQQP
jgi:hypothetical protein